MPTRKKSAKSEKPAPAPAPVEVFEDQHLSVDPATILLRLEENIRYSLNRADIDNMKKDILSVGKVETPVDVEELSDEEKAETGKTYILRRGYLRMTSLNEVNDEGAGINEVPIRLTKYASPLDRITRQVAENVKRAQMNPMDEARAIKLLLDQGMTRKDILGLFARPGGVKKVELQEASYAFVSMRLRFLEEFPKWVQDRIADGRIGVKGAYRLLQYEPKSWKAMVDILDKENEKEQSDDAALSEKITNAEEKEEKAAQALVKLEKDLKDAEELVQKTGEAEKAAVDANKKAHDNHLAVVGSKDSKEVKAKAAEAFKASEAQVKSSKEAYSKAKDDREKLTKKLEETKKKVADKEAKAEAGAKAKLKVYKPAGQTQVDAAAAATGAGRVEKDNKTGGKGKGKGSTETDGPVPLNIAQARFAADSVIKMSGQDQPKAKIIGHIMKATMQGILTDGQCYASIAIVTGEFKDKSFKPDFYTNLKDGKLSFDNLLKVLQAKFGGGWGQ